MTWTASLISRDATYSLRYTVCIPTRVFKNSRKEFDMGTEDVAAGKVKQIKGKANDIAGAARGDVGQQIKGKAQQIAGKAQEALGKAGRSQPKDPPK
jgi:uncharacterized protein YjbJ (UPF0337 family)